MSEKIGLSSFASDWVQYTCCQIVSAPLQGIVSSVWMWLQVCTKAMAQVTDEHYSLDATWYWGANVSSAVGGPLSNMKRYCPQELEGGQLTEWVVTTFFPTMESYNPFFKRFDSATTCNASTVKVPDADVGSVTLLLTRPVIEGAFGHLAMVLHPQNSLDLPPDLDTKYFVSFNTVGNTVGTMITGTKADHIGFGKDLAAVTDTLTIDNVNVAAMERKWQTVKENGQMFDLLDWNCARTVIEILQTGFPDCEMPLGQLWTPGRAFGFVKKIAGTMNVASGPQLPLEEVHARQIEENPGTDAADMIGVPVVTVVASVLGSILGTTAIAIVVAVSVICYIHGKAHKKLESALASLLIGAVADAEGRELPKSSETKQPSRKSKPSTDTISPETLAGPSSVGSSVASKLDQDGDGETDKNEFMEFAKEHNMQKNQAELVWKDLNQDKDNVISKNEWNNFIEARPNLKWLVRRLKSVKCVAPPNPNGDK